MLASDRFHYILKRDAAADAMAAMKAYQAGIAYAINFIVLYLILTLGVLGLVAFMGYVATARVRRSPVFYIIAIATLLCIVAAGINVSQNRDLVVHPTDGIDRIRYTSLIAVSFLIPFLCDFTLILRILAFYPPRSCSRWAPYVSIAFPSIIKVPRFIFIILYIDYCWRATDKAADMNTIIYRINQVQWAVCEWTLMLADQLYCTAFLSVKLYQLGWGWGDEKHLNRTFLSALRAILYSALASFAIPSFFLISLIVMQVLRYRPDIEGYVFAVTIHLSVAGAAFACLWPAIRADRRQHRSERSTHSIGADQGDDPRGEDGRGATRSFYSKHRVSLHKTTSCKTSRENLLELGRSPSAPELDKADSIEKSNHSSTNRKLSIKVHQRERFDERHSNHDAAIELAHMSTLTKSPSDASGLQKTASSVVQRRSSEVDQVVVYSSKAAGDNPFLGGTGDDTEDAGDETLVESTSATESSKEAGADAGAICPLASDMKRESQQGVEHQKSNSLVKPDCAAIRARNVHSQVQRHSLNYGGDDTAGAGIREGTEIANDVISFRTIDDPYLRSTGKVDVFVGGSISSSGARSPRKLAAEGDIGGIKIVTTREQWSNF